MIALTQDRLKHLLTYDPVTGLFTRNTKHCTRFEEGSVAGTLTNHGYIHIRVDYKIYPAHRLAFLYMTGEMPDCVDHMNSIRDDNRWCNLRPATRSENLNNSRRKSNNKSGVKGVIWIKGRNKWRAQLKVEGRVVYTGFFPDLIGAELAVRKKREELHGEYANHG